MKTLACCEDIRLQGFNGRLVLTSVPRLDNLHMRTEILWTSVVLDPQADPGKGTLPEPQIFEAPGLQFDIQKLEDVIPVSDFLCLNSIIYSLKR